jgi:hypothetical protein
MTPILILIIKVILEMETITTRDMMKKKSVEVQSTEDVIQMVN